MRQAVQSGNVNAVSFPITYYDLVNKIDIDVDYLTWHTGGERWIEFYLLSDLIKIRRDERVKVILVHDKSSVYR